MELMKKEKSEDVVVLVVEIGWSWLGRLESENEKEQRVRNEILVKAQ